MNNKITFHWVHSGTLFIIYYVKILQIKKEPVLLNTLLHNVCEMLQIFSLLLGQERKKGDRNVLTRRDYYDCYILLHFYNAEK